MTRNQAQVEVIVPDANAELIVEGKKMNALGTRRLFVSPELETGRTYVYTIKMQRNFDGRIEQDTRTVEVQAGVTAVLNFNAAKTNSSDSRSYQLPDPVNAVPKADESKTPPETPR